MKRESTIRQQITSNFKTKDQRVRKKQKPAWAHTEESKQDEDEVLAEEELDQLIQFTENLDFDKYLDTEEVVCVCVPPPFSPLPPSRPLPFPLSPFLPFPSKRPTPSSSSPTTPHSPNAHRELAHPPPHPD